jgi:hypothetical protein
MASQWRSEPETTEQDIALLDYPSPAEDASNDFEARPTSFIRRKPLPSNARPVSDEFLSPYNFVNDEAESIGGNSFGATENQSGAPSFKHSRPGSTNTSGTPSLACNCFIQKSCKSLALELFFSPPTLNLSNLLIEASVYCYLYTLNKELKGYPIPLSDSRNT